MATFESVAREIVRLGDNYEEQAAAVSHELYARRYNIGVDIEPCGPRKVLVTFAHARLVESIVLEL